MAITINIIGAGRAGRTLARVFATSGAFTVGDVFDRSRAAADSAVAFVGSGRPVDGIGAMRSADVWMITPPDGQIVPCGQALGAGGLLKEGNVVFHCSGATPSRELKAVLPANVAVASVHPLRSFADPAVAARTFGGTYCAAEGDEAALAILTRAFGLAGAHVSRIDPEFKTIYHAASVIVCNYLTALMEAGLQSYEKAGLARGEALRMMEPLVRETLDNVFRIGTVDALTGPIARGDVAVVKRQAKALAAWNAKVADVYRVLGAVAVELAEGKADAASLAAIARALKAEG